MTYSHGDRTLLGHYTLPKLFFNVEDAGHVDSSLLYNAHHISVQSSHFFFCRQRRVINCCLFKKSVNGTKKKAAQCGTEFSFSWPEMLIGALV